MAVEKTNPAGKAGSLYIQANKQASYDVYTKIKARCLTYRARDVLNGGTFN